MVALAAAAARTSRLLLATGIYLLPLRQPLLTARAGATLAELSGQRVLLGVGAGWLREEFDALGVPFDERYSRLVETVEILRTAWAGGPFSHHGRHFDIDSVQLCEDPVRVPLILGGNGPLALRRAAALGDGWMSSGTPQFEEAMVLRDRLTALRQAAGRRGEFPLWFRIANPDPALVERYRREGFTNLLVWADQVKSDAGPRPGPGHGARRRRAGNDQGRLRFRSGGAGQGGDHDRTGAEGPGGGGDRQHARHRPGHRRGLPRPGGHCRAERALRGAGPGRGLRVGDPG